MATHDDVTPDLLERRRRRHRPIQFVFDVEEAAIFKEWLEDDDPVSIAETSDGGIVAALDRDTVELLLPRLMSTSLGSVLGTPFGAPSRDAKRDVLQRVINRILAESGPEREAA